MTLSEAKLKDALLESMRSYPKTLEDCITAWYDAYLAYAKDCEITYSSYSAALLPTATGNEKGFKEYLTAAFTVDANKTSDQTSEQMALAFSSFWVVSEIDSLFPITSTFAPVAIIPNPNFPKISFPITDDASVPASAIAGIVHEYTTKLQITGIYYDTGSSSYLPFTTYLK